MKVGIITFHAAHNYGSMLLSFALQEAIQRLGHDAKIINLRIPVQNLIYSYPLKFAHKIHLKAFLLHPFNFWGNCGKWRKFEAFSLRYHNLTARCQDLISVERTIREENFDALISGGDQIWNMQCADFSIAYYLPFNFPAVKKISYAPSFGGGGSFRVENYSSAITGLLADFDCITVRERPAADYVTSKLNRSVDVVCDPVMLLDNNVYEAIAGANPLIKGKYIFYYSPFGSRENEQTAIEYGKRLRLPVYTSNCEYFQCRGMKKYLNAGPTEFLNLIKNAEIVCGNSFHMLAFCLLLNKNFIVLSKEDSRMENLKNRFGIKGHFYSSIQEIPTALPPVNWEEVNIMIEDERKKGIEYLKYALGNE